MGEVGAEATFGQNYVVRAVPRHGIRDQANCVNLDVKISAASCQETPTAGIVLISARLEVS